MSESFTNTAVMLLDAESHTHSLSGYLAGQLGCTVRTVKTVAEARRMLDRTGHDVAFVDHALTDDGGSLLVEWALASGKLKTAYCLSGYPTQTHVAGFEAVVAKPVDLAEVRALLEMRVPQVMLPRAQRDRLVVEHMEWATRIAGKVARRVPSWVVRDDLVSAAMVGLVEASQRFEPGRGQPFAAFAEKRVRGAVLDELRRGDIMSRQARQTARKVTTARHELEQQLGRAPEVEEVSSALDVTVAELETSLSLPTMVGYVDLDTIVDGESATQSSTDSPIRHAERNQARAMVQSSLAELGGRDAEILSLYYKDDLGYAEIGKRMGVSESRVCQLHGRAIGKLRDSLDESLAD